MKIIKLIGSILMFLFTVITGIVTLISGCDSTIEFFNKHFRGAIITFIFGNIVYIFVGAFIISLFIITYFVFYIYRKKIGTRDIPCGVRKTIFYKFINKSNSVLSSVHVDLYHRYYELKRAIRKGNIRNEHEFRDRLADYLYRVHIAIEDSFGLDVTITLRRLMMDSSNNFILAPYIHFRSAVERKKAHQRVFLKPYLVLKEKQSSLQKYYEAAEDYVSQHPDSNYWINSIYNYLYTTIARSWLSNNLVVDAKRKQYYSNSQNYQDNFYHSTAIFKISPPEKDVVADGLIIFDMIESNRFSSDECTQLMGFIAHLFYDLFIEMKDYEESVNK